MDIDGVFKVVFGGLWWLWIVIMVTSAIASVLSDISPPKDPREDK